MITFDFFNDSATELVEKFCEYYRLDKETVEDYFIKVNRDTLSPETLVKKFDLKLNEYDSSQMQIVCRHMTTSTEDEIHSFMDKGILDLKTMLQEDTPLSRFLLEHKIKVNVDEHKIEIKGKTYPILRDQEICPECYNGRERICTGYSRCDSFKKLTYLATKLYYYDATVECFIHATLDEMKDYSTISSCPEILNTLDDVRSAVNGHFSTTYNLCYDWMAKKRKCYVLEYASRWSKMETFAPMNYREAYREYESLLYSCGFDFTDYMEETIPKKIYDNITFLRRFISIYFYNEEEYGSLLAGNSVPPEALKVFEVRENDLVKVARLK